MHPALVKTAAKDLPDFEIAQRIAAGDRDQLRLLMRRYNQRLYRTARSILKDDAEAEDAVQEAYLLAGIRCLTVHVSHPMENHHVFSSLGQ